MQFKFKPFFVAGVVFAAFGVFAQTSKTPVVKPVLPPVSAIEAGFPVAPDSALVLLQYDSNKVYEIRGRVGMFTNIEVASDEEILGFYISDTTYWKFVVAKDKKRVLVRPGESDRFNSGTLVTNKRSYELAFRSYRVDEPSWHQRVRWTFGTDVVEGYGVFGGDVVIDATNAAPVTNQAPVISSTPAQPDGWLVDVQKSNFGYVIDGAAPFRPTSVFDDGVFTYFLVPNQADMPAIFAIDQGQPRLVDYVVKGDSIKVHRISDAFMFKLNTLEVRVTKVASK